MCVGRERGGKEGMGEEGKKEWDCGGWAVSDGGVKRVGEKERCS
jgi:hypothetical protein